MSLSTFGRGGREVKRASQMHQKSSASKDLNSIHVTRLPRVTNFREHQQCASNKHTRPQQLRSVCRLSLDSPIRSPICEVGPKFDPFLRHTLSMDGRKRLSWWGTAPVVEDLGGWLG